MASYDVHPGTLIGGRIWTHMKLRQDFKQEEVDCLDAPDFLPCGSTWKLSESEGIYPTLVGPSAQIRGFF